MIPRDRSRAQSGASAGRATAIAGFAFGLALVVLICGLVLAFGSPVYNANCLSCHVGPTGGSITDDPPRHNANGHTWHHPDCALRTMVREGSAGIVAASRSALPMQPFKDRLSPEDIAAVIAYIKTMWTPPQRQAQASFTREMCFEGTA